MSSSPPDLLARAGLDWRLALPDDLRFVIASWFESARKPFLLGAGCPYPGLAVAVAEARRLGRDSLLARIYHQEQKRLIWRALEQARPLVLFDVETPSFIVGWAHPAYCYVKQDFRGQGIGTALRLAVASRAG